ATGLSAGEPTNWLVDPTGVDPAGFGRGGALTLFDKNNRNLTYFTPRIEGLQFGASYLDQPTVSGELPGEATGGRYGVGLNFARQFHDVGVAVAAGYAGSEHSRPTGLTLSDTVGVGAQVSIGGFTLGGSVAENVAEKDGPESLVGMPSSRGYDFGLSYQFGSTAVTVSRIYGLGFDSITASSAVDPRHRIMLSGRYSLGSQLDLKAGLAYSGTENEESGKGPELGGWSILTGLKWSF
ncbi:MAG: porin, partial [Actinobacteria bacterium]|nr:porin [Actinomycetota bacterium]